jgi:predicted GIY-YIG superfamily endonuclease
MVHWVYVVKCDDDFIYVGETTRLYKRFTEHIRGRGSQNTHRHKPKELIGLYRVNNNHSFINYRYDILNKRYNKNHIDDWGEEEGDYLRIENHITERYLWERRNDHEYGTGKEWYRVRGGKYTYKSLDDALEISRAFCSRPNRIKGSYVCNSPELRILQKEDIVDRPLCNHGYPAEVNIKKDKTKIYFTCPIPNWGDFDDLERDEPCKFWKEYEEDRIIKIQHGINQTRLKEPWMYNIPPTSRMEPDPCVVCNKKDYNPEWALGKVLRLCSACLCDRYEELQKKYKDICLIVDD